MKVPEHTSLVYLHVLLFKICIHQRSFEATELTCTCCVSSFWTNMWTAMHSDLHVVQSGSFLLTRVLYISSNNCDLSVIALFNKNILFPNFQNTCCFFFNIILSFQFSYTLFGQ